MTKQTALVVNRLKAIVKEAEEVAAECVPKSCDGCKWNLRCARAMKAAIKLLEKGDKK